MPLKHWQAEGSSLQSLFPCLTTEFTQMNTKGLKDSLTLGVVVQID